MSNTVESAPDISHDSMHSPSPSSPQLPTRPRTEKRKRIVDNRDEVASSKPVKRKKSKKVKYENDDNLDLELGLNLAIRNLDSRLLADYIAQRTKRFSQNLSLVELEDLHISGDISTAIKAMSVADQEVY